ncbi:MAG: DoxX family protein [Candidatus Woesearchaeota archaeon]
MFKALENAYEFAPLPLRIGLAAVFITSGVLSLMNTAATTNYMASISLPAPMVFAIIFMVSQLIGGLFILLGLLTRLSAIWMTLVLLLIGIMAYGVNYQSENLLAMMTHIAWIGATLCLMMSGPGRISLDEKYFWE